MAKFHGIIGFSITAETSPGVFTDVITERSYNGDLLRNNLRWENTSKSVNDDINIGNRFSIIVDNYFLNNIGYIKYIIWNENRWKISSIDIERPRAILIVGGIYNG